MEFVSGWFKVMQGRNSSSFDVRWLLSALLLSITERGSAPIHPVAAVLRPTGTCLPVPLYDGTITDDRQSPADIFAYFANLPKVPDLSNRPGKVVRMSLLCRG
jgi:hypothetical protein